MIPRGAWEIPTAVTHMLPRLPYFRTIQCDKTYWNPGAYSRIKV